MPSKEMWAPPSAWPSPAWRMPLFCWAATVMMVLTSRVAGPSDLYDQDQPKTVAYTVDIVRNGRWALPKDMLGRWATKPPMYNWIGSPFVAMGWTDELALKMPAVIATLAVLGLITWMAPRLSLHPALGWLAGTLWLANYAGVKLAYLARPDGVLAAFLTGAWCCATLLLTHPDLKRHRTLQLALWLCVAAAALTKGLPALLIPLYIVAGARLLGGSWRTIHRTGIVWGLPLALAIVGLWLAAVYQAAPDHFKQRLMGFEMAERISGEKHGGPWAIVTNIWMMPAYFLARFAPASIPAVLAWIHLGPRRWLSHPTGPMTLWVLLTIAFFSFSAGKRADYLAPAYPQAALLAAWWLLEVAGRHRVTPARAALGAAGAALGFCLYVAAFTPAARTALGDHVVRFAHEARRRVGDDPIVFIDTGYNPLQSLIGRNQAAPTPSDPDMAAAKWIIRPSTEEDRPIVLSEPIPEARERNRARLGLYRADDAREPPR